MTDEKLIKQLLQEKSEAKKELIKLLDISNCHEDDDEIDHLIKVIHFINEIVNRS